MRLPATMFDYPEAREAFGDKAELIRPKAVILSYPVTVALEHAHKGSFMNLFGKPYGEIAREDLEHVSLDLAVTERTSPAYIWHTLEDTTVPPEGSIMLASALKAKGINFMLDIYPYGPHAIALGSEVTAIGEPQRLQPLAAVWADRARAWFETL